MATDSTSIKGFAAWPNHTQTIEEIATAVVATLRAIDMVNPVPSVWMESGSREPITLERAAIEPLIEAAVWRSDLDGTVCPERGYAFDFIAWSVADRELRGPSPISLSFFIGDTKSRAGRIWPNSILLDLGGRFPDHILLRFARSVMQSVIKHWPADWEAVRSSALRKALPRSFQPAISIGEIAWIANRHAVVPAALPGAQVEPFHDGSLIVMESAETELVSPHAVLALDAAMREAGSLPPIPANRSSSC